jgi:hypothetical protein
MTALDMATVTHELKRRGIPASFEHPGVIHVSVPATGTLMIFGDANDTINGDVYEVPIEGDPDEVLETGIPSDCDDFMRIADSIACFYTEACGKAPEYQMPELDPHDAAGGPEALEKAIAEMIKTTAFFQVRCAAFEWLQEHPGSPNAPAVRRALLETSLR